MLSFLGFKYYDTHITLGTAKREIVLSLNYKRNNFFYREYGCLWSGGDFELCDKDYKPK